MKQLLKRWMIRVDYFRINLSHTNIDDLIPIFENLKVGQLNLYAWIQKELSFEHLYYNEIIVSEQNN